MQLRTALKRLKEIMEGKSQVFATTARPPTLCCHTSTLSRWPDELALPSPPLPSQDSDLKQYWMPDSQCKECYDCNEKFTTFRRRHHCRLCGQIFCSRCCNQEIPGKFMGYTG